MNDERITRCPVPVIAPAGFERPCGEPLEATRAVWLKDVVINGDGLVVAWGSTWGLAEQGEDGTRFYCRNDHSDDEIVAALKEGKR